MEDKNLELMEKAPIPKAILSLALPTVFSSIVTLIYNLADTYFIGLLHDMYQLGAVSLAYPIFTVVQAIGNIFSIGAAPFISRSLGAQKYDDVKKASAVSAYTAVIVTFVITAAYFLFHSTFLGVLGTSADTYGPTRDYLDVIVALGFLMTLQIVLSAFLRAEGKVKESVIGLILGNVVNIILDPIFILRLGLGAGGAAWATMIGNAASVVFFLFIFLKRKPHVSIRFKDFKPSMSIYKEVLKIGIPASARQILMGVTNIFFNNLAADYGDYVIAGYGVAGKMIFIAIVIVNGYTSGYMPFAGYNLGANKPQRVKSALKFTLLSSTGLCVVLLIPFLGLARTFMGIFTPDPDAINAGVLFLNTYAICLVFLGIQFTMMSTLQVLGKATRALIINIGRQTLFFFPLLYLFNNLFQLKGLIAVNPIADVITTIVAAILAVGPLKKFMQGENAPENC